MINYKRIVKKHSSLNMPIDYLTSIRGNFLQEKITSASSSCRGSANMTIARQLLSTVDWLSAVCLVAGKENYKQEIDSMWASFFNSKEKNIDFADMLQLAQLEVKLLTLLSSDGEGYTVINAVPFAQQSREYIDNNSYQWQCEQWDKAKAVPLASRPNLKAFNNTLSNGLIEYKFDNQGNLISIFDKIKDKNMFEGSICPCFALSGKKLKFVEMEMFCQEGFAIAIIEYKCFEGKVICQYRLSDKQQALQVKIVDNLFLNGNLLTLDCECISSIATAVKGQDLQNICKLEDGEAQESFLVMIHKNKTTLSIACDNAMLIVNDKEKLHCFIGCDCVTKQGIRTRELSVFAYEGEDIICDAWEKCIALRRPISIASGNLEIMPLVFVDNESVWVEGIFASHDNKGIYMLLSEQYGKATTCVVKLGFRLKKVNIVKEDCLQEFKEKRLKIDAFGKILLYVEI